MKFSIERNALRDALSQVSAAIASKSTLPILGNVLITAVDGKISFNATDLDTAISVSAPGEVQDPGEVTLPAKRLLEIAKLLPDGVVRFAEVAEGRVTVEGGKARFKLLGTPTAEFPSFPTVTFTGKATTPAATIQQMIEQVTFAAARDDGRPILTGVLWELRPDRMRMVATNGHKLAMATVPASGGDKADVIVPPRALELVRKLFAPDAEVEVARTDGHIGFRSGDMFVLSRLVEGPYPNYTQVLPKGNDRSFTADCDAFVAALRRVSLLASDQTHRVTLRSTEKGLTVATQSPDLGDASESVAGTWEGDAIEIGANAAYLLDALRRVPTDSMRMTFKAPERVMTVEPVGWDDPATWLALVMPLRLT